MEKNKLKLPVVLGQQLLLIVLALLHYTIESKVSISGFTPFVALVVFVFICNRNSVIYSLVTGLVFGLVCGAFTSCMPGFYCIMFMIFGFFISLLSHFVLNYNIKSVLILVSIFSLLYYFISFVFYYFSDFTFYIGMTIFIYKRVLCCVYNSVIGICIYLFVKYIEGRKKSR